MLELHAIAGPAFGAIFRMEGATAVLGSDARAATWAVASDITLAPKHCQFEFADGAGTVTPIGAAQLTINGEIVKGTMPIGNGDVLATGASMFSVVAPAARQAPSPPLETIAPPPELPTAPARTEAHDAVPFIAYTRIDDRPPLTAFLADRPGNLYAVIDAARSPIVFPLLQQCAEPHVALFTLDGMPEDLKAYAPYVAKLGPKSVLLQQLVLQGWADHWCVFLSTPLEFEAVRIHLKKFLMVKLDDNREVFFRFYDPRVLRVFLPACTRDEADRFFGGIETFYCADAEGACIEYRLEGAAQARRLSPMVHRF